MPDFSQKACTFGYFQADIIDMKKPVRVIEIEHGSFTPLVISAYGGVSRETERFMSRLITKIAEKKDVPISTIANYVRTELSFILVRSQVLCIRGSRKLWRHNMDIQEAEVVQCVGRIREQ